MKVLSTINACMLLIYAAFFLLHRDTLGAEESEDVTDWISPVCHKLCGTLSRACGSTKCTWQSPDWNRAKLWGSQWNTAGRTLSELANRKMIYAIQLQAEASWKLTADHAIQDFLKCCTLMRACCWPLEVFFCFRVNVDVYICRDLRVTWIQSTIYPIMWTHPTARE